MEKNIKKTSEEYCDEGWTLADEYFPYCYRYFPYALSWKNARLECQNKNFFAFLISIHLDGQQYELEKFILSLKSTSDFWLGGYFEGEWPSVPDPTWRWYDQTPLDYFHNDLEWQTWNTEEYPGECLSMQKSNGYWINRNCTVELPFVCGKIAYRHNFSWPTWPPSEPAPDLDQIEWWEVTLYVLAAFACVAVVVWLLWLFDVFVHVKGCCHNCCHNRCCHNQTVPMEVEHTHTFDPTLDNNHLDNNHLTKVVYGPLTNNSVKK